MSEQSDTPTHRYHILQMDLDQIKTHLIGVRARRAVVLERIAKAKSNSKIEREATANKQLKRLFFKLERDIAALDADMASIEDTVNKGRALILELSDGEVALPKIESTVEENKAS